MVLDAWPLTTGECIQTSIVDEDIKTSKLVFCYIDQLLPVGLNSHIGSNECQMRRWRVLEAFLETLLVHIGSHDLGTFGDETFRDGSTEARSSTCSRSVEKHMSRSSVSVPVTMAVLLATRPEPVCSS